MYEFHPVANLFPMMDDEAFEELCKDIQANGLIEPIWLHDGRIIDGRNRYRACQKVGIPPLFRNWNKQGSLVDFVLSLNLHRRHLTQSQKAAIVIEALPIHEAEAKERQRAGGGDRKSETYRKSVSPEPDQAISKGKAVEQLAAMVGVGKTRIAEMKKIAKEAPEKVEAIKKGEISIDQALKEMKGKEAQPERKPMIVVEDTCTEAMQFAVIAECQLERIRKDDPQRVPALMRVRNYIDQQLGE